jgi:hypothetical protein
MQLQTLQHLSIFVIQLDFQKKLAPDIREKGCVREVSAGNEIRLIKYKLKQSMVSYINTHIHYLFSN